MDVIDRQISDIKNSLDTMRNELDRIDNYYTPEKMYLLDKIQKDEKKLELLESLKIKIKQS